MDGPNIPAFLQVLTELMDQNNDVRSSAEAKYESLPSPVRARLLVVVACTDSVTLETRQLAVVLFRRLITTEMDKVVAGLPQESFASIKSDLLKLVKMHPCDPGLKKKICDAASELAKNLIDDDGNNQWPDFLNLLFEFANSAEPALKECALNMFAYVPGVFGNQQARYLDVIRQMLLHCLSEGPTTNLQVRTVAVRATASFALAHTDEKAILKTLQDTALPIIQLIASTIMSEEDHCDTALNSLVEIAEKAPSMLRGQFDPLMQLCIKGINEPNVVEARRHLCLEIIVSMAEAVPATIRKRGSQYLNDVVQHTLKLMTEIDDDEEWASVNEIEDDDFDSDPVIGETSLDRLACAIGGKTILPLVVSNVSTMLQSSDFKVRVAALMALSAVGEGCHAQMSPLLTSLVDGVVPFLKDPHPRVRHAACNAVGQMATDFAPDFQEKFHAKTIPSLLELLDDHANPRVQSHAGAALVNIFEDCTPELVRTYLHPVAVKLEQVLKAKMMELSATGNKLVLEQTVVTLASLADSSQENFLPYYDTFVPSLKYIIEHAMEDQLKTLRGKAIEAVSLIGLAVGRDKFCSDATDVMNLLLRQQTGQEQLADDDPQLAYMIAAWARICKILGPAFQPYLKFVMGPVLRAASIQIEVALMDKDDAQTAQAGSDWQCVNLGDQQTFGIKTTGLEEKATACQMIVCYARELKEAFVEYVEETAKIMVPLLKFYFHEEVRSAAAESLPYLLDSVVVKGKDFQITLWNYFYPELLKAIEGEPEREVLCEMISSLASCIEKVGRDGVTPIQLEQLIHVIDEHLKEHFLRAQQRIEKRKDEDYDEGVEEILEDEGDEDVYILSKVSDILHTCFVVFGPDFLPYFDRIVNHFKLLAGQDRSWTEHQWAICVFDDVIEHTGPASIRYKDFFLPLISEGVQSRHPEIRQAAVYGWGVLAKFGGGEIAQSVADVLPVLVSLIQSPDSRSEDNVNATENAISAVTKILQFNSSKINVNEMLGHWFSWLPVYEDEEELPHVYGFLMLLIESNHPIILGENNCNLPRIVAIFAEVLARNAIELNSEVGLKIASFLKQLQSNEQLFRNCTEPLSPGQKLALSMVN